MIDPGDSSEFDSLMKDAGFELGPRNIQEPPIPPLERAHKIYSTLPELHPLTIINTTFTVRSSDSSSRTYKGLASYHQHLILEDVTEPSANRPYPKLLMLIGSIYPVMSDEVSTETCQTIAANATQSGAITLSDESAFGFCLRGFMYDSFPIFKQAYTLSEIAAKDQKIALMSSPKTGSLISVARRDGSLMALFLQGDFMVGKRIHNISSTINGSCVNLLTAVL